MDRTLSSRCRHHLGERPKYFCCDQLICESCKPDHLNHNSVSLEQKSTEIKQQIPSLMQTLNRMQTENKRKLKHTESLLRKNEEALQKNKENINKRIKEVISYIKKAKSSMMEDCDKRRDNVNRVLNEISDYQKKILYTLEELHLKCETLDSYNSFPEIIRVGVKVTKRIGDIDSALPCQLPEIPEFVWPHHMPGRDLLRKIIGTINDGVEMDSDYWTTDASERIDIVKHFKWEHKNVGIAPIGIESGWIYQIEEAGPIHMVSENGYKLFSCPNEKHRKIEKIAATRKRNAWVTDLKNQSVKVLHEAGQLQHRLNVSPFHPFGICPTKCGQFVWICLADKSAFLPKTKGRTMVAKMTALGETVCKIESQNEKQFFAFPYRCAENSNEDLCVIDRVAEANGQVYIFDKHCNPKCGYIGTTVDRDFDPRDVCCNSNGNIIIADLTNNAIHILNQEGILERLLKTASQNYIHPLTAATDLSNRIWITFCDGNIIIINYP